MTAVTRHHWLAALLGASLWVFGCGGGKPAVDGGTNDSGTANECTRDEDCPAANLFQCINFECVASCRTKTDCTDATRKEHKLAQCSGALGCECEDFKCVGALCSDDSQCDSSTVCRNGACVTPPVAATVASCAITPDLVVGKTGTTQKFWVSAWNAAKEPVVVKTGITWAPVGGAVTGAGTGASATFTLGAATAGTAAVDAVEATIGTTKCTAKARILPALTGGNYRALVTDELTGRTIPNGGRLIASNATTGAAITTVDIVDGLATFTAAGASITVTAFHPDYGYLTIANYSGTGADAKDLSFVLRRNQTDKYGGYKGTFTGVPQSSNVHAGIAGMSLAGTVTDLSLEQLLGTTIPTDIKIGTVLDQKAVPLPAGVYLGFTDTQIKSAVSAQGLAGVCADDAKVAAGTCGTRTAWAMSGDIPISDLPLDAFTGGGGLSGIDFGKILTRVLPIFKRFNSSVVRDVEFSLKPAETDGGYNTTGFTSVDHAFNGVPLGFGFVVKSPALPKYKGVPVDGVVLVGGASVPGRGVVPLGLGVGVNTAMPIDDIVDAQGALAAGSITMRMAPTHHGIEGSPYGVIGLATSIKAATDATAGLAASAIFQRLPENKLVFDPAGTSNSVTLAGPYLPIPEGGKYNFTDLPQPALPARTFKFTAATGVTGASIVRVIFTDAAEHRWTVVVSPSDATAGFTLPKPPAGFADRTYAFGNTNGSRSTTLVQTLKLNSAPSAGGAEITFDNLVELNSTNADRLIDYTASFALLDYSSPGITFLTPAKAGDTVAKNTDVKVRVGQFKVGTGATDDGVVRLEITGGNASAQCAAGAVGNTDASQGKGEILIRLPTDCTGTGVTLRARLYNTTNTAPIDPIVSREITANIQ